MDIQWIRLESRVVALFNWIYENKCKIASDYVCILWIKLLTYNYLFRPYVLKNLFNSCVSFQGVFMWMTKSENQEHFTAILF